MADGTSVRVDRSAPTLTKVTIASDHEETATIASVGDKITLSFHANEDIQKPVVKLAAFAAAVAGSNDGGWVATLAVTEDMAENHLGRVSVSVTFQDLAGNAGVAHSKTTDKSTVDIVERPTWETWSVVGIAAASAAGLAFVVYCFLNAYGIVLFSHNVINAEKFGIVIASQIPWIVLSSLVEGIAIGAAMTAEY